MLSIISAYIIFSLSLIPPSAAAVSFNLSHFDRESKSTCSPQENGIFFQGDAFLNQGLQLTKNQLHSSIASSVGRAVYSQPVQIWDSTTGRMADFTTQFSFIIHDVDPRGPSGDGLAFFLSSHPSVLPENSAGGFLGLFPNSSAGTHVHSKLVAIEFDTYPNSELDSSPADHIGINVNSIRLAMDLTLEGGIKKRTIAKARVHYLANRQTLTVALAYDGIFLSEGSFNLSLAVDLREVLPEFVSIGFSAATGSFVETHTILSWSFDSNLDAEGSGRVMVTVAGVLMVGFMFVWLLVWKGRKTVVKKVENANRDGVLPSGKNGRKKDHDIIADEEHVVQTGVKEEVTDMDNVLREESGQGLVKDEDISLDDISLVEGGSQTEVISPDSAPLMGHVLREETVQGQVKDEDISLDDISLVEGGSQTEVISPDSAPLTKQGDEQEEEGIGLAAEFSEDTNLAADNIVHQGGESQIGAPISDDLLDRWSPKEISRHVLVGATNNFSEEMVLGKGVFGLVYRGFLSDVGLEVAIKKLSETSQQGTSEFMSEVKIITQLRQRNLVKLIGWCREREELMLVYEFMPNGSLESHLFRETNLLEWPVRYKIALGLANALIYLHDECEPYVLHRDIKSSNVLLDYKFDAKLADFGLAKLFNLDINSLRVTHPAGTRGYWAPEYALMSRASRRSDVYSFGVVALEIACGKKAILVTVGEEGESDAMLLVEWVWDLYGKGAILDAADGRLNGNFDRLEMERLLMVGLWCAHPDHRKRPSVRRASNTLLFPQTNPLPNFPRKVIPWAYPLGCTQMQTTQLSTTTSTVSTTDGSVSTPSQIRTVSRKLYRRVLPRFTSWLRGKSTSSGKTLDDNDSIRTLTGLKEFSYKELVQATNNFSSANTLGKGGFSSVHRGLLLSGIEVAVRRCQNLNNWRLRAMRREVMTLGRLAHRNLVKLIGWCHEGSQYVTVYEYMAHGSFDRHLFGAARLYTIPWEVRYKAAISLASALCYLHNDWELRVVHRDIKPSNMFLDKEFNMKLGGFEIARPTDHVVVSTTTTFAGTMGYIAPEYYMLARCSAASDVYSFGVVALEIACGRRSYDWSSDEDDLPVLMWWRLYASGELLSASDEKLMGVFNREEMERLMVVGLWCVQTDPALRPPIAKVIRVLQFEEELPALVPPDDLAPTLPSSSACENDTDDLSR